MPNWLLQALAGIFGTALLAVTGFLIEQHAEIKVLRAGLDALEREQAARKEWQAGAQAIWHERAVLLAEMSGRLDVMQDDVRFLMDQVEEDYQRLKGQEREPGGGP